MPWKGERGFLDRAMLERALGNLLEPTYYLAGPPGMVEALKKMVLEAGVPQEHVRTDEFFGY
jgi:ferredoxin-NADP reductase